MVKYIILDFGKVLAYPSTGNWFVTPKFLELVNINEIDEEILKDKFKKYAYLRDGKIVNCEEEYKAMFEYYDKVLSESYSNYNKEIVKEIAYNFTYGLDKYKLYNGVKEELEELKKHYTLLLLSDNWPCVLNYMKENEIYDYFEKIYVSSIYGQEKKNGDFFDNPIKDFNIKNGEAIFIDDNEKLLDVAITKGLYVRLMNREKNVEVSKYKIVNDLKTI